MAGRVYVDQALPFGLRSAPILFTVVADAIGWALMKAGIVLHLHYLDDFLFFLHPLAGLRTLLRSHVLDTLANLHVPVATNKIEGPATTITFLGIQIDTISFELRLTAEKLEYISRLARSWRTRRSGRSKDFDSLLGHLSHAATVIRQGRTFLRSLYDIQAATTSPYHHVHLNAPARADLLWWDHFLHQWNGSMFYHQPPVPTAHIYTDASGSYGAGGVWTPLSFFQVQWPPSWNTVDIVTKELVPVVMAAALWGRH